MAVKPVVVGDAWVEISEARRSDAHAPAEGGRSAPGPATRLGLLRGFELTHRAADIQVSIGAQRLLAFLALSNRPVRRSRIAGTLWGDVPEVRAAGNLRSAIWRLRHLGFDLIRVSGDHLHLSPAVNVDTYELTRLARLLGEQSAGLGAFNLDDLPVAGELLPGWDEDWVVLERERLRQIALHVLDALCERWTREQRYAEAVRAGLAAIACEPLRESSQRALISAFLAEGNPTEALRRYRLYREALIRELKLEPSGRITSLVADI